MTIEINDKINFYKSRIEKTESYWDQIPPEGIPDAIFGQALKAEHVALYYLLLGNKDEGLIWCHKTAELYQRSIMEQRARAAHRINEITICLGLLNYAILSGDWNYSRNVSQTCLEMNCDVLKNNQDMTPSYYCTRVMSDIVIENIDEARNLVGKITDNAPRGTKKYFEGLKVSLEGILNNDKGIFLNGLDVVLQDHYNSNKSKKIGPPDEMLSVPAMVLIKLAGLTGITIKPDDVKEKYRRFVPWLLYE